MFKKNHRLILFGFICIFLFCQQLAAKRIYYESEHRTYDKGISTSSNILKNRNNKKHSEHLYIPEICPNLNKENTVPIIACTGNADFVWSYDGYQNAELATGAPDGTFVQLTQSNATNNTLIALSLPDVLKTGQTYSIRWANASSSAVTNTRIEESYDGYTWVENAASPFSLISPGFINTSFTASINMKYVRITDIDAENDDVYLDAISYTGQDCCEIPTFTQTILTGTCNGAIPNNDASISLSGISVGDRADISTANATAYDGDNYANAENISGGSITFSGLQHGTNYYVRIYNPAQDCPYDIRIMTANAPMACETIPTGLPWMGSNCNGTEILLRNGVGAITCGTTTNVPPADRWAFAMVNFTNLIPASGRIDVSSSVEPYHHASWLIDSIGNVYGLAINSTTGETFLTASSNFGAGFTGQDAIIRYGAIAGGNVDGNNDAAAGGAIYRIDPVTGQATLFTSLPQQPATFTHEDCESADSQTRTNSGVGLGNIVYDYRRNQYFVSNFEDGKIYRLDASGAILETYDPLLPDNGAAGISNVEDLVYGLAISPDGTMLFMGGVDIAPGVNAQIGTPGIYSINLSSEGGFVGMSSSTGLGYNNFTGTETLHTTITAGGPSASNFVPDDYVYSISDLAFNANGDLIAGMRVGCDNTIQSSYNHFAETNVIALNGVSGLYDIITELNVSATGDAGPEDGYGGVASYIDSNGNDIIAVSSADVLDEIGPHGIAIFNDPPNTVTEITPLATISYGIDLNGDPKGIGADIELFEQCIPLCEITGTQNTCVGTTSLVYSGPAGATNYTWTVTSGDATINGSSTGQTVTIDAGSNDFSLSLTISPGGPEMCTYDVTVNSNPTVTVNNVETCAGNSTTISAAASNGDGSYTYAWSVPATVTNPGNVASFSASVAGNYSVTVTDGNNCTANDSGTLTVNPNPSVTVNDVETCTGSSTTVSATASGGDSSYSYAWSVPATVTNPGNVASFSASVAGNYSVTVTDGNNCTANDSGSLTINSNPSVTVNNVETCTGSSTTVSATASGGDSSYSYAWSVPAMVTNPGNVASFSASVAGNYSVTVTDGNNCTANDSGTLTVNSNPSVTVNNVETCAGSSTTVSATASGGDSSYSYAWTVPATVTNPGNVASFSASVAGNYSVTVTDGNNCTANDSGTLTVNPNPSVTVNDLEICAGNSTTISATASNGDGSYTYAWSVPATVSNPGNVTSFSASVAGNYSVTVTDGNNCTANDGGTLTVNPNPTVTVNDVETCAGSSTTVSATASGGDSSYSYAWTVPATVTNPGNVASFSASVAGNYSVTVTDGNNCTANDSGTLTINANPAATAMATDATCSGTMVNSDGTITLSGFGATDKFSYTTGATYTGSASFASGSTTIPVDGIIENSLANPVSSQQYTVRIFNSDECYIDRTVTLNVTDCSCTNPVLTSLTNENICEGGSFTSSNVTTSVTNSIPVTYLWYNNNGTDNPTTNLIAGQNTASLTALPNSIGSYSYRVEATSTIDGSCQASESVTLIINQNPTATVNNVATCAGNSTTVSVNASGGDGSYSYAWTVPATVSNPGNVSSFSASVAGSYSVTVTDGNNCTTNDSGTLTVNPNPTVTVNDVETCAGSSTTVSATASGGDGSYSYAWTVPATVSNPGNVASFSASVAGSYSVTVTDGNNCTANDSGTLTVNPNPTVTVNNLETCAGSSTTVSAMASGGDSSYSYSWSVPAMATNPGNVASFSTSVAGSYSVTVTDGNNCTANDSGTLTVNALPVATAMTTAVTCNGSADNGDGMITITGFNSGERYDLEMNSSYTGSASFASGSTVIPVDGIILNNISNPSGMQQYTIRIFNSNECFIDRTVTLSETICVPDIDYADYDRPGNSCADPTCHIISNDIYLGTAVSADTQGSGSTSADSDNDDGLSILSTIQFTPGNTVRIPVSIYNNTGMNAYLRMWIDWNGDGDFEDTGEQVENNTYPAMGTTTNKVFISVTIPTNAIQNQSIALRARLSTDDANSAAPCGNGNCASDGEVEDYLINISCPTPVCAPVTLQIRQG